MIKQILHRLNRRDTRFLPKSLTPTKIILIILILFTITFTAKTLLAQDSTATTTQSTRLIEEFKNKQSAFEKGNNQESWIQESISSNAMVGINALAGTIPDTVLEGKVTSWVPGGIIGLTNRSIAQLYTQPISGVEYIAQSVDNFLGKPVYAQSTGFSGLKGIQSIWKSFRNTVYILISLVFVVMGIMIMLRVKISPQATVTIQSTIPKLITTLILVTFSYAIAGLIIDLSYVVQGLVLSILFSSKGAVSSNSTLFSGLNNPSFGDLMKGDYGVYSALIFRVTPIGSLFLVSAIPAIIIGGFFGAMTGAAGIAALATMGIAGVTTLGLFGIGALVGILIVFLFLLIFTAFQVIKLFFALAKTYINLIFKIILSPLEIGLGAIPNSKIGFSSWITQTIAYALVFPICLIFLVALCMILEVVSTNNLWAPGILSGTGFILTPILGLSGLMLISKLPNMIPELIFQIKPSPLGKGIGEGLKSPISMATRGMIEPARLSGGKLVSRYQSKIDDGNATPGQKFKYLAGKALTMIPSKKH